MEQNIQSAGPQDVGPAQDNAPMMQGLSGLADTAQSAEQSLTPTATPPAPAVTQQNTTPPPDQPGTHSKLISMLQHGLIGLGAAGKALATHGKEGGVKEVADIQEQEQQSQRAEEDLALRRKAQVTQLNMEQAQTANILQNMSQSRQKFGMDILSSQVELANKLGVPVTMVRNLGQPDYQQQVYQQMGGNLHDNVALPSPNPGGDDGMLHAHIVPTRSLQSKTISVEDADGIKGPLQAAINGYKSLLPKSVIDAAQAQTDSIRGGMDAYTAMFLPSKVNNMLAVAVNQIEQQQKLQKGAADVSGAQSTATTEAANAAVAPEKARLGLQQQRADIAAKQTATAVSAEQLNQMRSIGTALPPGFSPPSDSTLGEQDLRKQITDKGVQVPSNFSTLYAIAKGDTKLSTLPTTMRKGVMGMTQDQATTAIRTLIDPKFTTQTYETTQKVNKDYSPGGDVGKNIVAFNTAAGHLAQFYDAAGALKNGDVQKVNQVLNSFGRAVGDPRTITFDTIKNALVGEMAKVFGGSNVAQAEKDQIAAPFQSANSVDQLIGPKGAIITSANLMKSKTEALREAYKASTGKDRPDLVYLPEGKAAYDKLGVATQDGEQPVFVNSKVIGYTKDGKSMRRVQ